MPGRMPDTYNVPVDPCRSHRMTTTTTNAYYIHIMVPLFSHVTLNFCSTALVLQKWETRSILGFECTGTSH